MISKLLAALLVFVLSSSAMATSLSLLHGSTFRDDQGYEKERTTYTLEHFGVWELGTVFFYYDITDPFSEQKAGRSQFFGGTSFTLSWNKLFGINFGQGVLRDISFRGEFENGSGGGTYAFRNYFYGLQADLAIPGFDFFSFNTVIRENPVDPGVGIQFGAFWQMSQEWSRWRRFKFTGFVAASPWEGDADQNFVTSGTDKKGRFLTSQPQLLWDLGNGLWAKPNRLEVGAEFGYFLNRFQAHRKDEKVLQALLKVSW
jgi:nucleoside-specific outer membrane channel protein Tsx